MELRSLSEKDKEFLSKAFLHVEEIVGLINSYPGNREGSFAVTKLEEAMHWMNSMVATQGAREELANKAATEERIIQ